MRLHIITIVLDGIPWIASHLPQFNKLQLDWKWHIMEGVAGHADTWWKLPNTIKPRLSNDGTTKFLDSISSHSNIVVRRNKFWTNKMEMINAPMEEVEKGDIILEVDSDEFWNARQIETLVQLLSSDTKRNCAAFFCRYFMGPNLITTSKEGYGNHGEYEWFRAWKACKDFKFTRHEFPVTNMEEKRIPREETETIGLVFDHYAYVTKSQVKLKEEYYGYENAVEQWEQLQNVTTFPVDASSYCKWIKTTTPVDKLHK